MNKLLLFLLVIPFVCFGQKHDNNWSFSHVGSDPVPNHNFLFGYSLLSFQDPESPFQVTNSPINMGISGFAMSDSLGKLLFYTNGYKVLNSADEIIENGEQIGKGRIPSEINGNSSIQACFGLPQPNKEDQYYIFSNHIDTDLYTAFYEVSYSKVNMSANNGKGRIDEKAIPVFGEVEPRGDILLGTFAAVRHGNGRDWWILVPDLEDNNIYRCMLTPNGIENKAEQTINNFQPDFERFEVSQNKFSPDGNFFAFRDLREGVLHIYDFDRCSGLLLNERKLKLSNPIQWNYQMPGIEFSPNGKFIYCATDLYTLIQIDLEEPNLQNGIDTIAMFDDYRSIFGTGFAFMQATPNEKIIISPASGEKNLHIINAPNEKGKACELMLHSIQLPRMTRIHHSYYPNYRLYDFPNSPCDTLGIDKPK